jgi:hypothetical protein
MESKSRERIIGNLHSLLFLTVTICTAFISKPALADGPLITNVNPNISQNAESSSAQLGSIINYGSGSESNYNNYGDNNLGNSVTFSVGTSTNNTINGNTELNNAELEIGLGEFYFGLRTTWGNRTDRLGNNETGSTQFSMGWQESQSSNTYENEAKLRAYNDFVQLKMEEYTQALIEINDFVNQGNTFAAIQMAGLLEQKLAADTVFSSNIANAQTQQIEAIFREMQGSVMRQLEELTP